MIEFLGSSARQRLVTYTPFFERTSATARWAPIVALLLLSGCLSTGDPEYAEKAIRGMLQNGSNAPAPSDLPKVGDSDWCIRVTLALDNPKLPPAVKNQYAEFGRTKGCQRALAAQPDALSQSK